MERKHFVLVHNAFHGAWIWYKLKPMLESAGHRVTAMDLAASGIDPTPIEQVYSFDEYSEPLLETMKSIPEGEKVILVGFSLGGTNVAVAADKYPEKIAVAVFVNSFMPDTKHKPSYVLDKYMENPHDWKDCTFLSNGSKKLGFQFLKTTLYQNCPLEDYELARMLTRPASFFQEVLAKRQNLTDEGYGSVSKVCVIGEDDKAIPKEFQLWEIENIGVEKVYMVPGGDHMLMLSKPQQLLNSLLEVAASYA